jgi:Spy/CpxP family protein refolding chaperone
MIKKLIILAAIGMAAVSAFGQGFRGGMAGMMTSPVGLMNRDDVRTELQLTDDQKNKLAELRESTQSKIRETFQNASGDFAAAQKAMEPILADANDQINKILTADQQKRLKEIGYQIGGYAIVATDKDLQTSLALTDEQKSKISDLFKTMEAANASLREKASNQEISRQEAGQGAMKNRQALSSQIEGLLTAEQKSKFKDMQGKPFTQTSSPYGGRPGGGN